MKMTQQLKIKQNQSLIMTPQLQQAIKLLQLSNIELSEYVENAKEENPFLKDDLREKTGPISSEATEEVSPTLNTFNKVNIQSNLETSNTFDTHISANGDENKEKYLKNSSKNFENITSTSEIIEKTTENKISLQQYLLNQINIDFDNELKFIASYMIDYLHPSGWLLVPLEQISAELKVDLILIEKVVKNLQNLEPVGIFARNLSECLKIQLIDKGIYNNHFEKLIDNLDLLTKGKIKQLSKICDVKNNKIIDMVNIIKTLNPKPGETYSNEEIQISQPDVIVSKTEKGWKIDLNRSTLPTVKIDEEYIEEINNLSLDEKSNEFSHEKIGEAKWLKKAVEQRNKTILKVTSEILKKQTGFFKHGFSHMKPMILKDVADAIGMHESTISRVTNSKLILTEWGLLSMKDFFSASIASTEESDKHAASAVREALKKLISSEVSSKPLSDEKIADVLSNGGMDVARRTVAKYRDMLNIPSSAQRRRNANFNRLLSNG